MNFLDRRVGLYQGGILTAGYLVIALLLTYPLIFHVTTHLPLGTEPAATVPLFNLWTLLWNTDRLAALYQGYWHAPIFFPTPGTFALSEPQPLTGLLFTPVYRATTNAVFAYNFVFLLNLTLNGISAYCLARTIHTSRVSSFLTGILAQTLPFVTNEWGVLQLTAVYPIFFTLTTLTKWSHHPTRKNALLLAIWGSAVFWTSVYYGLFLVLFVGLYGVLLLTHTIVNVVKVRKKSSFQRQKLGFAFQERIATGLLILGIIALLLFPMIAGQLRYTAGYSRSESTIQSNSAQLIDYARLGSRALGSQVPWLAQDGGSGQRLYPGTGLIILGMLGAIVGVWRGNRWWVLYALLSSVVAFLLSLGLNWMIGEVQPYQWVREYLSGYRQLRSPFRLAIFVQIFLVSLSPFTLDAIGRGFIYRGNLHWVRGRPQGSPLQQGLAIVVVGLAIVEVLAFPARLYAVPPTTFEAEWIAWFRTQPPGAAVVVPFVEGSRASNYQATTIAMIQTLSHHHPLANGYSGFFPDRHDNLKSQMQDFPSSASITTLQAMGVQYIIVHREWEFLPALSQWQNLEEAYRDREVVIFTIMATSPSPP